MSVFNTNAYNTALWHGSRVLSLGQIRLGHDPRLSHLITHDPYCPCGMQGLVQRHFKKAAALLGTVVLPLVYWKWKKADFVVFAFFTLVFVVMMREIFKRSNESLMNKRMQERFADSVFYKVPNVPLTHTVHMSQDGPANCGETFGEADWHKTMQEHSRCLGCQVPVPTDVTVYNFAVWGLLNVAVSWGQSGGVGHVAHHQQNYYPFEYLNGDDSSPVTWTDGHTYPREELIKTLGLCEEETRQLTVNKFLKELIEDINKPQGQPT